MTFSLSLYILYSLYYNIPFWIESSGISYCVGSYKICREDSDIYLFEYVIDGTGSIIDPLMQSYLLTDKVILPHCDTQILLLST